MAYGNFGGFGGGNLQQLMRQAQKMQDDMKKTRDEIDATEYTSTVGGGMVEITMMGNKTLKAIKIKPEVVDPDDVEMLEDLIVSAVNDVIKKITTEEQTRLPNIPGM
ncbi:MAG: YbaB/EbfC family nucleoid-associated protein [Clostridia bacterium]|nr:YbaB/EbfC family nucleoid-associated protein [Clostridia bacterium]